MKKLICLIVSIVMILSLTGCGVEFPEMTNEQEDTVSNYAAVLLLKYDAHSKSRLVKVLSADIPELPKPIPLDEFDSSVLTDEDYPTADEENEIYDPGSMIVEDGETEELIDTRTVAEKLSAAMNLPETIQIEYTGASVMDEYPEDSDLFALTPTAGKKFVIVNFVIKNISEADVRIDLYSRNISFSATFNDTYKRSALQTLVLDDLSTFAGDISPESEVSSVLVFEIPEDIADSLDSVELNVKSVSNSETIPLL